MNKNEKGRSMLNQKNYTTLEAVNSVVINKMLCFNGCQSFVLF